MIIFIHGVVLGRAVSLCQHSNDIPTEKGRVEVQRRKVAELSAWHLKSAWLLWGSQSQLQAVFQRGDDVVFAQNKVHSPTPTRFRLLCSASSTVKDHTERGMQQRAVLISTCHWDRGFAPLSCSSETI